MSVTSAKASSRTWRKHSQRIPSSIITNFSWFKSHMIAFARSALTSSAHTCRKDSLSAFSLLGMLASATQDPDAALHHTLAQGVPTGIFDSIAPSVQMAATPCDAPDDVTLLHCSGNWTRAESNPETLKALLRNEIEQGWVKEFPGSIEEAKQQWLQHAAIGKLNLVFADGKEPRLVLDSSVCNANQLCSIPEHVALPSSLDVRRSFMASDRYSRGVALLLMSKQRTKGSKCDPLIRALLFAWQGKLYSYTVCHFGAKLSAYWWQRIGAQIAYCTA